MLLMSKLGARVSSGLQKGIWKAFFVFSLKGANEIPVLPSCREKETRLRCEAEHPM